MFSVLNRNQKFVKKHFFKNQVILSPFVKCLLATKWSVSQLRNASVQNGVFSVKALGN